MFWLSEGISILIVVALPFGLGAWLARRHGSRWGLFWAGAVTFVASQVVHLPLNALLTQAFAAGWLPVPPERYQLVFNVTLLGLTAGLCEETARYLVLRLWQRRARGWRPALMFGAGHGGIEAVLTGGLIVATMLQLAYYSQQDLASLGLPPEALTQIQAALAVWNTSPFYLGLVPALERIFAICLHLGLSVMVMRAVTRRNLGWLLLAIAWHTAANAVALWVGAASGNLYLAEVPVAVFALASLGIIWLQREPAPAAQPEAAAEAAPAGPTTDVVAEAAQRLAGAAGASQEHLERTRYE
jgi:uncharacterized membrane protein YhfC